MKTIRSLRCLVCLALAWGLSISTASAQEPGTLVTVAGGGAREGEGIPATDLALNIPWTATVDAQGNIYIADAGNHRIRRVDAATGEANTVAGTGAPGFSGDGGPASEAELALPLSVAVDASGNLYIADTGNHRIRRVDAATGLIATIAGNGEFGFSGDGGPASEAIIGEIVALAIDGQGRLYIAEGLDAQLRGNHRVRSIDLNTGTIATVAGNGDFSYSGDGGPATDAGLTVEGIALDPAGNLYIADFNNHRIRRVDLASGVITTVAGRGPIPFSGGEGGFGGDGGPATRAQLNTPAGVAVDAAGNLYIADNLNNRIRAVDAATDTIVTIAGTGLSNFSNEGGLALEADLSAPTRLDLDPDGNLIIVDAGNDRIRRLIDPTFRTPILALVAAQIDFQEVSIGDPRVRALTVENLGNRALTILGASSDNPDFVPVGPFPIVVGPAQSGEVAVRFDPQAEGVASGILTLITDDPRQPTLAVPLRGSGSAPDVGVLPAEIVFGRTFVGRAHVPLILQVSNLGVGVLVIPRVAISDTAQFSVNFTDTLRIPSSQVANLSVTFRPTLPDTQRAELTLFSNDPDEPALAVPLKGFAQIPKPGGFAGVGDSLGVGDPGDGFGATWADYDGDGDPDLYVVRRLQSNLLYRNDGGRFTEMAAALGVDDPGDGSGAAWADIDRDGDLDLYVTNFGQPNLLYRNDGGRFTEMAAALGVDDPGDGYGAAWADYDGDGDPDLYVANFGPNRFYRNDRTRFVEVAGETGLADAGSSIQPAWADYDADGDPDLFLANSGRNRFFRNNGGLFADATADAGLQEPGLGGPSFGAAWGDFDNDGDLDLYVPHFSESNRLYQNDGTRFREVGRQFAVAAPDTGRSRGAVWGDFDNDGDLDLYVTSSGQKNNLFRNDGNLFVELADSFRVAVGADSRGVALADYDGDGGLDIFVAVQGGADRLFRNQEANDNWIAIRPKGTRSSPDAICARFEIVYGGGRRAVREITGGSAFLSQDALSATFGLGTASSVDTLTIRWPLGIVQRLFNLPANTAIDVVETPPLPPASILLRASTPALVANGQAQTDIFARIVNARGEVALVNGLPVIFNVDFGDGAFVGTDTVLSRDGLATARFRAGQVPGQAVISARAQGLSPGQFALDLLPQLGPEAVAIRTVAGFGVGIGGFSGDRGPATNAQLNAPRDVAADTAGVVYIADSGNNRIRTVGADSIIRTIVGNGITASTGNGGPAEDASVADPRGLAFLPDGDLLLGEQGGQVVRRIDIQTGIIDAFAGRGISGFGGDGRAADRANFTSPVGVAADREGNVYIADQFNNRIRKVDTGGIITTFAGSAQSGFFGDGGPATQARLTRPQGVAVDSLGRVYIADTGNHRVRMVDTDGTITTLAGTGQFGSAGDGGPGILALLNAPRDVAIDGSGRLYIADTGNHLVRLLDLNLGIIQTVAGTGFPAFDQDEGSALETSLDTPSGVAVGVGGRIYVADTFNHRIRELTIAFPNEYTPGSPGAPPDGGPPPGDRAADFNSDGRIDFSDFVLFASAFGSLDARYDLSGNGRVGFEDFVSFVQAFERSRTARPSAQSGRRALLR